MRTLTIAAMILIGSGCVLREVDCAAEPENRFCDVPSTDAGERDGGDRVDAGSDAGGCTECDEAHCVGGRCVACTAVTQADDCPNDLAPVCNEAAGECVQCVESTDCSDPTAPRCDPGTFTCGRCFINDDCAGVPSGFFCEVSSGACVECNAADESECGTNVCDVENRTCTTTPAGMTGLCQSCVSDRQCRPGQVCAPMEFMTTTVGYFCLWRQDATEPGGPMGDCTSVGPYGALGTVNTRSGDTDVNV
jgi:hypothetical protein